MKFKKIKQKAEHIVKKSSFVKIGYTIIFSTIFKIMGFFIQIDDKLIIFNSFGGKKYDDSPKVIYDKLKKDPRFNKYRLVWAFHEPNEFREENMDKIKVDTFEYFYLLLKAKVWITNSGLNRGLRFKKRETICVNTWHGTPIKLMGHDLAGSEAPVLSAGMDVNLFTAQSKYDIDVFSNAFKIPEANFVLSGLPRNDDLIKKNCVRKIDSYKEKLKIPKNKKVLLYAPTFREFNRSIDGVKLDTPIDIEKWKKMLGEDYIVLFRAHYEIAQILGIDFDNHFILDVSDYPVLNELLLVSDSLISDYSSIMIDYSILERPIYCFAYDYTKYENKRGFYFSLKNDFPVSVYETEDTLLQSIVKNNKEQKIYEAKQTKNNFVTHYGNATEKIINKLYEKL